MNQSKSCWVLYLNDMRAPRIEIVEPVARASTKEELEEFIERERVEHYLDGRWGKSFRKGGPLEWYNGPFYDNESFRFIDIDAIVNRLVSDLMSIPEARWST